MAWFTSRNAEVEAITFDELVEHGRRSGANIVDGMPWSFEYRGMPVTHENDECYIVSMKGYGLHFTREHVLATERSGESHVYNRQVFDTMYEEVEQYDAGLGTTPGMWEFLSDLVEEEGEKLPESLSAAINALSTGEARLVKAR